MSAIKIASTITIMERNAEKNIVKDSTVNKPIFAVADLISKLTTTAHSTKIIVRVSSTMSGFVIFVFASIANLEFRSF